MDQGHFENVETRNHFTPAHGVGHLALHSEFHRSFPTDEAWKAFHARG